MRWLGLLVLFVVGACAANQQTASVWQKSDGTPVGPREMRSALLACGNEMADRVYAQQTPYPLGSEGWVQQNWQIEDSSAYGLMSNPEVYVCLHSFGYTRVETSVGEGSSIPPPRVTRPPNVDAHPPGLE